MTYATRTAPAPARTPTAPFRAGAWRIALAALLTILAGTATAQLAVPRGLTPVPSHPAAPEIALKDVDGKPVKLSDLRGRVVVVNFWATWCPPCRKEIPSLGRLQKLFKPEQLTVLAVNIGEDDETVFSFIPAPNFIILLDLSSASLRTWRLQGLPATYVIDPEGRIALRTLGGREFDDPAVVGQLRELMRHP